MSLPSRESITKRLDDTLEAMVNGTFGPVPDPPDEVKPHLDAILAGGEYTVRDGMLTLLGIAVEHGQPLDWNTVTVQGSPARAASRYLGTAVYKRLNIVGSKEALQTGVKGLRTYRDRGTKRGDWEAVLDWASSVINRVPPRVVQEAFAQKLGIPSNALEQVQANARADGPEHKAADIQKARALFMNALAGRAGQEWTDFIDKVRRDYAMQQLESAFHYLAAGVAATARSLPPMPALDTPKLTFPAVFALLDDLLTQNSGGAYEQYMFAALLAAWREQLGEPGVVETKNLNASDASAGTAADVQERHRGQVTEAYEVTAAGWDTKVDQAEGTLRRHDLPRVHIVARNAAKASGNDIAEAVPAGLDLTVRDVREEVRSMLSRLSKPYRRDALEHLYDLLVSKQPDDALVQDYVAGLNACGLTETP